MEVYEGLLSSGNIRYLGDELQEMLAQIRHSLKAYPFNLDPNIHAEVVKRLDEIMESRSRHFTMLPFWMCQARRKLRSGRRRHDVR